MELKKLTEVCSPKQWKTISQTEMLQEGYPVYGANGIIGYYNEYNHENPTVLITCRGATCGTLNISKPFSYVNGNAMALDNVIEDVDEKYLYYYLQSRGLKDIISGSAQPQITIQNLTKVIVSYPSIEEQKRIVSMLDKADEIRAKKKLANDKLDEFLKSTFISMFGDPVTNTKNFQVKLLKDISTIISGGTPSRQHKEYFGGNIPWVTTVALGKNYIDRNDAQDYLTELGVEKSATHIIPKNSLLFGSRVGVGKTSVNLCDICTNQDILSITNIDSDMFNMTFIKKVLEQYTAYFETQKRGATIKGISADVVKNISIPIAPIDLQNKYLRIVEKVEAQKQKNELVIEQMNNLFNSLSQRSFRRDDVA